MSLSPAPQPSRAERVAREDMVMFINACFACSGQREFYDDGRGQSVSIEFLHRYILGNYRRLYARTLAAGINHYNQAQVIVNLLAHGAAGAPAAQAREEGELIWAALVRLPPPRAYRVLEALRDRRVNNRRARAVTARYLRSRHERGALALDALKYRAKLRIAATHAHVALPGELGGFLYRGWQARRFSTALFESYRQAHFSQAALYELPYTVAEGFAAKHGVARDEFLAGIEGRMTHAEKLRLQSAAARSEVALDIDLGKVGLTRLAMYLLSLSLPERARRHDELLAAARAAAGRAAARARRPLGKVAAVLDASYSSSGSSEKRRRPLAVAWAVSQLLRATSEQYLALWAPSAPQAPSSAPQRGDDGAELYIAAAGQTCLAEPLLDALQWGAELILIVSDGYENDPPLGAAEVARVFRERLDRQRRVSIVHVNPVFDAEHYAPRALGPAIPTVGLRDAEDLPTMLGFARFADGAAPLDELEAYLEEKVALLLHAAAPFDAAEPSAAEPSDGAAP